MKFLFVTYCFGNSQGQALIGVYKRGLRIALELSQRGHEIVFFCTGRENFHDELTALAEERMHFIDIPFEEAAFAAAEQYSSGYRQQVAELGVDAIIIGEAPLAGTLLETTLCAAELNIPVICLDNAYQPGLVALFCQYHGGIFDRIVLTGPSSLYMPGPPAYLAQVPPYFAPSPQQARTLLSEEFGLRFERLIVVLAYDLNVERLATSIFKQLELPDYSIVVLSSDAPASRRRLEEQLPAAVYARTRVIAPPPDPILFGLIELAQLAIVKCAFMQVTECLSLQTPIVGFYYVGDFAIERIPNAYQRFAHTIPSTEADEPTLAAVQRLLAVDPEAMRFIHNGEKSALVKAADFLEQVGSGQQRALYPECANLGFTPAVLQAAVGALHPTDQVTLQQGRTTHLRNLSEQIICAVVCTYTLHDQDSGHNEPGFARLWGRLYRTSQAVMADIAQAQQPDSPRTLLYYSVEDQLLLEKDLGPAALPSLEECEMVANVFVPPHIITLIKQELGQLLDPVLQLIQNESSHAN